jgi:outer membrane protein OmpA-like peptidoglycan-associated protein
VPAVLAACALWLTACAGAPTKRETGALGGAALGAGVGALIGHATGNTAAGAAIGGALGGVGGAVVGDQLQSTDQKLDARQTEIARNRELIEELKRKNLEARETDRGVVVNLPDVLFEFGKSSLTSEASTKVRDIADILDGQRVRNRPVSVEGHTDSIGGDGYNRRLSERRAQTVATALETEVVSSSRVHTRGFGKKYPIAPNRNPDGSDDPAGRAKNRRVEVIIEN